MKWRKSIQTCLLALLFPCGALFLVNATKALSGGSTGGSLQSGRFIAASSDSISLSIQYLPDTATIRTAGKTIVVSPTTIEIDKIPVATIDESVSNVQIQVKNGVVTFLADGQPVDTNKQ